MNECRQRLAEMEGEQNAQRELLERERNMQTDTYGTTFFLRNAV